MITKYKIYCNTESQWTEGFLENSTPTTCFNNTSHDVNANSVQEIEVIKDELINVKILEETIPTGGNFRCEGKSFVIQAGEETCQAVSWKYPITVLQSSFSYKAVQEGDVLNVVTASQTLVGIVTQSVSVGATVIHTSLTVVQNANLGYNIYLGSDSVGEVIGIDFQAQTITLSSPTSTSYSPGTYIRMDVCNIRALEIGPGPSRYIIGRSKTGGKHLPPNVEVCIKYKNNGQNVVIFKYEIEYLY